MNSKDLIQRTLRGREIPRPPYIPFLGSILAKLEQKTMKECLHEPGLLMSSLYNAFQLFGHDAITLPPDCTAEAEAFGAQIEWDSLGMPTVKSPLSLENGIEYQGPTWLMNPRISCRLETVTRLTTVHGRHVPIFATITGPLTVLRQLYGNEAPQHLSDADLAIRLDMICKALLELCKQYGDAKVDGVIIYEDTEIDMDLLNKITSLYTTLCNVIKFYNMFSLLRLPSTHCIDLILLKHPFNGIIGFVESERKRLSQVKGMKGLVISENEWRQEENLESIRKIFRDLNKRHLGLFSAHVLEEETGIVAMRAFREYLTDELLWE